MESRGPQINHISFVDYIIIFSSTDRYSLDLIMATLSNYEVVFDQMDSKEKSHIMITDNIPMNMVELIKDVTSLPKKNSPINYLGCPLYIGH